MNINKKPRLVDMNRGFIRGDMKPLCSKLINLHCKCTISFETYQGFLFYFLYVSL